MFYCYATDCSKLTRTAHHHSRVQEMLEAPDINVMAEYTGQIWFAVVVPPNELYRFDSRDPAEMFAFDNRPRD